jgi:gluconolactonase
MKHFRRKTGMTTKHEMGRLAADNPLNGFVVKPEDIHHVGDGLQRPECVICMPDGTLRICDAHGGITQLDADGEQRFVAQMIDGAPVEGSVPNGLAPATDGSVWVANFGKRRLEKMRADGQTEVVLSEIEGRPLGQVNFILLDQAGRLWVTVSTEHTPFINAFRPDIADGSIILIDGNHARVVADGLGFPNEVRLDASEEYLYVAETTGRRISRFSVHPNGNLGPRETFGPEKLEPGFPDGIAFDSFGNLWIAMVIGEAVLALDPAGVPHTLLSNTQTEPLGVAVEAFEAGTLTGELMGAARGTIAPLITSVAFGGADGKTVYLGSLAGNRLASFRSPVSGAPMSHHISG